MPISDWIENGLQSQNITLQQLSKHSNVSLSTIKRLKYNYAKNKPQVATINKLEKVIGRFDIYNRREDGVTYLKSSINDEPDAFDQVIKRQSGLCSICKCEMKLGFEIEVSVSTYVDKQIQDAEDYNLRGQQEIELSSAVCSARCEAYIEDLRYIPLDQIINELMGRGQFDLSLDTNTQDQTRCAFKTYKALSEAYEIKTGNYLSLICLGRIRRVDEACARKLHEILANQRWAFDRQNNVLKNDFIDDIVIESLKEKYSLSIENIVFNKIVKTEEFSIKVDVLGKTKNGFDYVCGFKYPSITPSIVKKSFSKAILLGLSKLIIIDEKKNDCIHLDLDSIGNRLLAQKSNNKEMRDEILAVQVLQEQLEQEIAEVLGESQRQHRLF